MVPVQEHRTPVGDDDHVLLLPLPSDATVDDGGVEGASRAAPLTAEGSLGDVEDMARGNAEDRAWRDASRDVSFGGGGGGRGWGSGTRLGSGSRGLPERGTPETGLWARVARKGRTVHQTKCGRLHYWLN
jgi:hypothetical protein